MKKNTHQNQSSNRNSYIINEIKKRTDKLQLQELPVSTLDKMDAECVEQQEECVHSAVDLHAQLEKNIQDGQGLIVTELRRNIQNIFKEHNELGQQRKKISHARQQRILEDRLIEKLGTIRRVRILEWFILLLIMFVVSMLLYDLGHPELPEETRRLISAIDVVACLIFLSDFFFRLRLADSKKWFWKNHWIDFVTSIPLPYIPEAQLARFGRVARLARIPRLIRVARLLRFIRVIFFFWRGMDKLQDVLDVRLMKRSLMITIVFLVIGAGLIWMTESNGNGPEGVASFGESIWWSFTTLVTGGFGDIHNPQTVLGRIITVILVIAGMIVVGIFTATLTSVLVGDESEALLANQKNMQEQLDHLALLLEKLSENRNINMSSTDHDRTDS